MPKFYCINGSYRTVVGAINTKEAAQKLLNRLIESGTDCALISLINEKGFSRYNNMKKVSMIPFLRDQGIDLPSDDFLIFEICRSMNINPECLSEEAIDWILNGKEGEENNDF